MKIHILKLSLITALSCATVAALAENPFVGDWKLDYSQSHIPTSNISFTRGSGGEITFEVHPGRTTIFKLDGSDSTTHMSGVTARWTKVSERTWQSEYMKGPTRIRTAIFQLSSNENALTETIKMPRPSHDEVDTLDFVRMGSGQGFFGTWKDSKQFIGGPDTVRIEENGSDGLTWTHVESKSSFSLKFDGKEVPLNDPFGPANVTVSAAKAGPRAIDLTYKMNGQPSTKWHVAVSDDGKILTEIGGFIQNNESSKMVYRKM